MAIDKGRPEISVTIATRDGAPFIVRAIESVRRQTFPHWELLVGDDGSRDDTAEIVGELAKRDGRIRFFRFPKRGIAPTRNELNRRARGRYVAPLDCDDRFSPDKLAWQYRLLEKLPDVGLVYGDAWLEERRGGKSRRRKYWTSDWRATWDLCHLVIHHCSCLIRRELVLAVGGYDEALTSALNDDLWLKLGEVTRFHYGRKPCVIVSRRPNSVTFTDRRITDNLARARMNAVKRRYGVSP